MRQISKSSSSSDAKTIHSPPVPVPPPPPQPRKTSPRSTMQIVETRALILITMSLTSYRRACDIKLDNNCNLNSDPDATDCFAPSAHRFELELDGHDSAVPPTNRLHRNVRAAVLRGWGVDDKQPRVANHYFR